MTVDAPETKIVSEWRVCCDGGELGLGHPRVWLEIDRDTGFVECGYCDAKYIHEDFVEARTIETLPLPESDGPD